MRRPRLWLGFPSRGAIRLEEAFASAVCQHQQVRLLMEDLCAMTSR